MDKSKYWLKVGILLIVGVLFSVVLELHQTRLRYGFQDYPSACVINSYIDCDAVALSSFSQPFQEVSLAALGLLFFLLFGSVLYLALRTPKLDLRPAALFFSTVGIFVTVGLIGVSFFVVKKFCLYCSVVWIVNILLFILSMFELRKEGLVVKLKDGMKQSVYLFLPFVPESWLGGAEMNPQSYGSGVLSIQGVFAGFIAVGLSAFYVFFVSLPHPLRLKLGDFYREKSVFLDLMKKESELSFKEWQNSPQQEIPITEEGFDKDFYYGANDAPVVLVEFFDYRCPRCKQASVELHSLEQAFKGKIKVVIKDFPLQSECNSLVRTAGHDYSCKAAKMARCAGRYGDDKYWDMHRELFSLNIWDDDSLRQLPRSLKLPESAFWSCVNDDATLARLRRDTELGQRLGVRGTPTVFVNGVKMEKAFTGSLRKAIEFLLDQS